MAAYTKACLYCRLEFESSERLANICSPDCRRRAYPPKPRPADPEPPGVAPPAEGTPPDTPGAHCARCGKPLPGAAGTRKYCSPACRRSAARKARRARVQGDYLEPVSIDVLSRRDGGRCRICGGPVDFTRRQPHPHAATIDHVVPLARGGAHSYGNTQLAHYRCNTAKGAS